MQSGSFQKLGGSGNEVEADETFIGRKAKNMHANRRAMFKNAREESFVNAQYLNKAPVMGLLDREQRFVRASAVPAVNRQTLQAAISSTRRARHKDLHR